MEETIKRIVNEKTSDIFSQYQNLEMPMSWQTAKHQAATEVMQYIMKEFMDMEEPDYGEYTDLDVPNDGRDFPEDSEAFNDELEEEQEGMESVNEEAESQEENIDQQEEGDTPYDNMTMGEFLDKFNFYHIDKDQKNQTNNE
jgi:hypothetical protein